MKNNTRGIFCSRACSGIANKKEPNCTCDICGKKFRRKPSWIAKHEHQFCSMACADEYKKIIYKGKGNPRYGMRGEKCPAWRGGKKISNYGYIEIYMPEHPFAIKDKYVFEHRLVAEKYLLTEENSIEVNGQRYLKPEYEVHHIDFDRKNNDPNNLMVLTHAEHKRIHNELNPNKKDEKGRFMKDDELIKVKRTTKTAIIPERKSIGAAGYDLCIDTDVETTIPAHSSVLLPTGIAFAIPKPYFGAIYARSGLSVRDGLRPATCVSVIDSDYRGEVKVPIHNDTDFDKTIRPHERVAQIVFEKALIVDFVEVDHLDETERGNSGFGSTGK